MEDADKPFACTATGCGMKFVIEDHLTWHKKKHDMSLSLTGSAILKNAFVDQTPTPTRFIKNCDAVGLFQDLQHLTVNPFDEEFRKAAQSGGTSQTLDRCAENVDGDSLNTPTVIPLTTERQIAPAEPEIQELVFPEEEEEMVDGQSFATSVTSEEKEGKAFEETKPPAPLKENLSQPISVITHSTNIAVLPKKTISNSNVPLAIRNQSNVTTASNHIAATIPVVTTVPSQAMQQQQVHAPVTLIIKLSDGQMPYVTAQGLAAQPVMPNVCKIPVDAISRIPTTAKLKAAITSRASKMSGSPSKPNDLHTNFNHKNIVVNRIGPVATVQPTLRSASSGRRVRDDEEANPDEKRLKFLERNRAAAARCRTRKKQWVVSLQRKADELASTNEHLQREVALLRNEVAKLKTMLLAHKDCPITQQQRAAGQPDVFSIGMPQFCPPLLTTAKEVTTSSVFVETFEVEISSSDNSCDSKSLPGSSE